MPRPRKHLVTDTNTEALTGTCANCGPVKLYRRTDTGVLICSIAKREQRGQRPAITRRERYVGITDADVNELLADQGHACAICDRPLTSTTARVDHNHSNGNVRCLLCNRCNVALGLLNDDPDQLANAIAYLKTFAV